MTFNELQNYFLESVTGCYDQDEAIEIFFMLLDENNAMNRMDFVSKRNQPTEGIDSWKAQIERLQRGEPIQYVLGFADFWGMKINVSPAVLIPRPETEELVQLVSARFRKPLTLNVLDIGTGSGCIALSLKKELPQANVAGLDVSLKALEIANLNGEKLGLKVDWVCADIVQFDTSLSYDIIVSNPPYIPIKDKAQMLKNVLEFEPHLALFAPENDPLYFYKIIGDFAKKHLSKTNGKLYFEAHHEYANQVFELFKKDADVELISDMFGKPRFVVISFKNE